MDNDNAVMSQAGIDALLASHQLSAQEAGGGMGLGPATPPRRVAASASPGVQVDPQLAQRLEALESAAAAAEGLREDVSRLSAQAQEALAGLRAAREEAQALRGALQEMAAALQATPGYALRRSFQCGSCGEQGLLAVPARCTRCGHESWLGWWPQAS